MPDVTKSGAVKAHMKDLLDGISMEHVFGDNRISLLRQPGSGVMPHAAQ